MMEKILEIKETDFNYGRFGNSHSGYEIKTNKQSIKLGITNEQFCWESWGYFMSNDDLDEFVGANLIDVKITDECLNKAKFDELVLYEGKTMFVDIVTDKGILQFTAYNEHNGYYGHDAVVVSNQLTESECL